MTDLRKAAEMALERLESHEYWMDEEAIQALRQALAQDSLRKLAEIDRKLGLFDEPKQPEQEPETVMAKYEFQTYAAYKDGGEMKIGVVPEHTAWVTAGEHTVPLETAAPVDAVNMSQERVDETAKREHEPVAWMDNNGFSQPLKEGPYYIPLYTAPPKREWVGLTDDEMFNALLSIDAEIKRLPTGLKQFAKAIETKLKEKNT